MDDAACLQRELIPGSMHGLAKQDVVLTWGRMAAVALTGMAMFTVAVGVAVTNMVAFTVADCA